jgi:hypothetical protein
MGIRVTARSEKEARIGGQGSGEWSGADQSTYSDYAKCVRVGGER